MSYTFVVPDQAEPFTNLFMLSLAIYREARGETQLAKRAVGWVIRNRVQRAGWFGVGYFGVITKPSQFSSFDANDPNRTVFGSPTDPAWKESIQAAVDVIQSNFMDDTEGATFYYDRSEDDNPPAWSKDYTHTVDIGNFHFYKQSVT
jgi:N-acetylmuramoyl-L-alanine amidase